MAELPHYRVMIEPPSVGEILLFTRYLETDAGAFVTFPLWFHYPSGRREMEFFSQSMEPGQPYQVIDLIGKIIEEYGSAGD